MRRISTSKGCRSSRFIDFGIRPRASEISLLAPLNFPFGEVHVNSSSSWVLTIFMSAGSLVWLRRPCNRRASLRRHPVELGDADAVELRQKRGNVVLVSHFEN